MNPTDFKNVLKDIHWRYLVAAMMAGLLFAGDIVLAAAVYLQRNGHTEILVPAGGIGERYVFSNGRMPPAYLRKMTEEAAMLDLHYHYATSRSQFGELAAMFDPSVIESARLKYAQRAEQIEKGEYVSSLHIDRQSVRAHTREYIETEVKGMLIQEGKGLERKTFETTIIVRSTATTPFRLLDIHMEEHPR